MPEPLPPPAPPRPLLLPARAALILVTLAAFALRAVGLSLQSLWRDEVDAVHFALRPLGETLAMFTAMAQNGPLYFLSLRPWLQTVGSSEFALRLPSAFAGTVSVLLLWQVGRRLLGGPALGAPLLAALLLAVNPYALWYSQEGKMYAPVLALVLVAHLCWLRGITRGGWRPWLGYGLTVSLALYTHLLTVLLFPLHLLWFVLAWPQARRHWRGYALTLAALTLPYLPLLLWQWKMLLAATQVTGFHFTPLPVIVRTVLFNQARGFVPGLSLWWLAPLFFAGGLGLLLGWSEVGGGEGVSEPGPTLAPLRRFLLIVAWLVAPVLAIWLLSLRQPVFTDRYVLWTLPAALLLVALGIQVLRSNLGRAGVPAALLLAAAIAGVWLYGGFRQSTQTIKYDLRAAVGYVAERRTPGTLLLLQIPHLEYAWRYYTSDQGTDPFAGSDARLGRWAGGLYTNNGLDDATAAADVERQMRVLTAGMSDLWLIRSEPEMWDQRRLMDAWLARNGVLLERADFHGVQVAHLQILPPASQEVAP